MNKREQSLLDARIAKLSEEISNELKKKKADRRGLEKLYQQRATVKSWKLNP